MGDTEPGGAAPPLAHRRIKRGPRILIAVLIAAIAAGSITIAARSNGAVPAGAPSATEPVEVATIRVHLGRVTVRSTDNAQLFGERAKSPSRRAVREAVRASKARLKGYLVAQFAAVESRFTHRPLRDLLTPAARNALSRRDRRALGDLNLRIAAVSDTRVPARAMVMARRSKVDAVVLDYRLALPGESLDGGRATLVQRAEMMFVPTRSGWRADAIEVSLVVPPAVRSQG